MSADLDIRPPEKSDLPAMATLLAAEGFGDDALHRLTCGYSELRRFSLLATLDGELLGVLIASFNGWHILASHLAVAPRARRRGIGRALVETLARNAASASAKGIIVDARLSAVAFFQELKFRLPGAVFLVRDLA
jgi:GNAT superfamily N-acetyltransferase